MKQVSTLFSLLSHIRPSPLLLSLGSYSYFRPIAIVHVFPSKERNPRNVNKIIGSIRCEQVYGVHPINEKKKKKSTTGIFSKPVPEDFAAVIIEELNVARICEMTYPRQPHLLGGAHLQLGTKKKKKPRAMASVHPSSDRHKSTGLG